MIYIHIPFCNSFCTYCDFYSEVASSCKSGIKSSYVRALQAEIREVAGSGDAGMACGQPHTLYIGGGTPSVLPLSAINDIVSALKADGLGPDGEWEEFTVEVNPEDIVEKGPAYVEGLLRAGVTRVSMGVQSFDDVILKWMNRRHNAERAVKAYSILEEAGMENISIDLIFGMPGLTMDGWRETLERALAVSGRGNLPAHISSYQLSIEPGSALAKMLACGKFREAGEELCSAQYDLLCRTLAEAGYTHYEISNFALKGRQSLHNSSYWKKVPYIGFGPGAHSYLCREDGKVRRWNKADLNAYIHAGLKGDFFSVRDSETLTAVEDREEAVMLALRTAEGVSEELICREHPSQVERLLREGMLVPVPSGHGRRLRIPENHFFVSDDIIAGLI